MKEYIPSTDVGDEILCHFVSTSAYNEKKRFQALPVKLKGNNNGTTHDNFF